VTFGSGDYFAARQVASFHPSVSVHFTAAADQSHYHIPLLLSPYAYTTYRGS
jgi:5-hydroxyisourate hydrolase